MLYSVEKIEIHGVEKEVFLYLKNTRNHSYRIAASKISITLPAIYKKPETISLHKEELLVKIKEHLLKKPHFIATKHLLDRDKIHILQDQFEIVYPEQYNMKTPIDFIQKKIFFPHTEREKLIPKLSKQIALHYRPVLEHRIRFINQQTIQQTIHLISIKNNQSTWGLCSSKGEITISLNTLFAPLWVLDYVIVHELCHLIYADHSARFWNLVEKYYPKYREAKTYLKLHGANLIL